MVCPLLKSFVSIFGTGTSFSVRIRPECVKGVYCVKMIDEFVSGLQLTPFLPVVVTISELLLFETP